MIKIILLAAVASLFSCNNKAQTIKAKAGNIIIDTVPTLTTYDSLKLVVFSNDTAKSNMKITGFGYDIYLNHSLYIHQPNIPAVAGLRGFTTANHAYKIGYLVVHKIQQGILPPAVSIEELDSLGIVR